MSSMKRRRVSAKPAAGTVAVSASQANVALSRKVNQLSKIVKGIKVEEKFFDTALSFINVVDTTGAIQAITDVVVGNTQVDRIGSKILVKNIYVQVRVSTASLAGLAETFVRFAIVQDTQSNGAGATVTNVVKAVNDPRCTLLNIANQGRFKILKWFPLLDAEQLVPATATKSAVQFYSKRCNIPVTYSAATSALTNSIFVMVWTNNATDVIDCDGTARITFVDD